MPARRLIILLIAVGAVALTLWLVLRPESQRAREVVPPPPPSATPTAAPPAPATVSPAPTPGDAPATLQEEPGQLAVALNAAGGNIQRDLTVLDEILQGWRSNFPRGGNPVGDNVEITAALAGRNELGFAFIPRDHPAINERGQLCDRWGTPFFFHQLAGDRMELRSAGPDREHYTADDAVFTPGESAEADR